jgi:hypothetical protein
MQHEANMSVDLQKFIEKFQPNKFKMMAGGIEIRGVKEIHQGITQAKALIEQLQLDLYISHNVEMLCYGAFEVNVR